MIFHWLSRLLCVYATNYLKGDYQIHKHVFLFASSKNRLFQRYFAQSNSAAGSEESAIARKLQATDRRYCKMRCRSHQARLPSHRNPRWWLVCIGTAGSIHLWKVWAIQQVQEWQRWRLGKWCLSCCRCVWWMEKLLGWTAVDVP